MPETRNKVFRGRPEQARMVRARVAVLLGWAAALTMLPGDSALADGRKPPRPFPKYTVEVIYGMWCGVVGYEPINGFAVNSNGLVGGQALHCNQTDRAFLYPPDGPLFIMPLSPIYSNAVGYDVNDLDWIVGHIVQTDAGNRGFVYKPDGSLTLIEPPMPANWAEATAVNNAGRAVGWWSHAIANQIKAYRWEGGVLATLTELPGPKSEAHDISESGLITGWTGIHPIIESNAFIWNDSKVTLLPPIPGGISSAGYGINDKGDVCGQGRVFVEELGVYKWRAFAYVDGEMIAIPPLGAWTDHTSALAINSYGQVVGGSGGGYLWQDGAIAALSQLLAEPAPNLSIGEGRAINDDGWIVADGTTTGPRQSYAVTVLLKPIAADPADLSGDGIVNGADLATLLGQWGCCPAPCTGDLDDNGCVNGFDLAMLLASWTS